MPTLFDQTTRQSLLSRLASLTAETPRRWGTMTSPEMVAHCNKALRMALGDLQIPPKKMFTANPLVRHLFIHWLPVPKNLPTAPQLRHDGAHAPDFDSERAAMQELLERFGRSEPDSPWPVHPAFGDIDGRTWGVQQYGHIDHHFRQFGV